MMNSKILNQYHIEKDNQIFPVDKWDCFYRLFRNLNNTISEDSSDLITTYIMLSVTGYIEETDQIKSVIVEENLNEYRIKYGETFNFVKNLYSEFCSPFNSGKIDSYAELFENDKLLVCFVYCLSDYCQDNYIKLDSIETKLYNIQMGLADKSVNTLLKDISTRMSKKNVDFIRYKQLYENSISLKDFNKGISDSDIGEYVEELINSSNDTVKVQIMECIEQYLSEEKIEFTYSVPVSFLVNRLYPEHRKMLVKNIESIIETPEINESVNTTETEKEEKKEEFDKFEYLKIGGFMTFNKILSKTLVSEDKIEIVKGNLAIDDFIMKVVLPVESVKLYNTFTVYQGYDIYKKVLDNNKGSNVKLYYSLFHSNNGLNIEYGMLVCKYDQNTKTSSEEKTIIGGFKITTAVYRNLFTTKNTKPTIWLSYMKEIFHGAENFDMKNYNKIFKLSNELKNFKPIGYSGQESCLYIVNNDLKGFEIEFSFEGLGTWRNGSIVDTDLVKLKNSFKEFILENSWKKNVLYNVTVNPVKKFWVSFILRNR